MLLSGTSYGPRMSFLYGVGDQRHLGYWDVTSRDQGVRGPGSGVLGSPLRVGLVMFVPVVLDHAVAAYPDIWA